MAVEWKKGDIFSRWDLSSIHSYSLNSRMSWAETFITSKASGSKEATKKIRVSNQSFLVSCRLAGLMWRICEDHGWPWTQSHRRTMTDSGPWRSCSTPPSGTLNISLYLSLTLTQSLSLCLYLLFSLCLLSLSLLIHLSLEEILVSSFFHFSVHFQSTKTPLILNQSWLRCWSSSEGLGGLLLPPSFVAAVCSGLHVLELGRRRSEEWAAGCGGGGAWGWCARSCAGSMSPSAVFPPGARCSNIISGCPASPSPSVRTAGVPKRMRLPPHTNLCRRFLSSTYQRRRTPWRWRREGTVFM